MSLFDELKELFATRLRESISDEDFLVKTREISKKATIKQSEVGTEEVKLLKTIAKNYIAILKQGRIEMLREDIGALATFAFEKWLKDDDIWEMSNLIYQERIKLLETEHTTPQQKNDIEKKIMLISEFFSLRGEGDIYGMQRDYCLSLASKKFLKALKFEFDRSKAILTAPELKKLSDSLFVRVFNFHDIKYLEQLVDTLDIDLKSFTGLSTDGSVCSAINISTSLPTIELKSQYFDFLRSQGLHPDSDLKRLDFVKMHSMSVLLHHCNKGNLEDVKLLLRYGADINQLVEVVNLEGLKTFRTPFSVSLGSGDIEFVKYLVREGADPLQAMDRYQKYIKEELSDFPGNVRCVPTMGSSEVSSEVNDEYCRIIEQAYLQRMLGCLGGAEAKSPDHSEQGGAAVSDSKGGGVVSANLAASEIPELVSQYIDFKKSVPAFLSQGRQDSRNIENEFDVLLLEFLNDSLGESLGKIHSYIEEHPEVKHYAVHSILDLAISSDVASEVFAPQPALLHQFFTLKKQLCDSSLQQKKVSDVPDGVYQVKSDLKSAVYVSIAPALKDQLDPSILVKFSNKLSNCKFIKSDSKGISGIKTYKGVIKLKLAAEDQSLIATQKYLDKSTGNVLIIFDQIHTHKDKVTSSSITIHKVDGFSELWSLVASVGAESHDPLLLASASGGDVLHADGLEDASAVMGDRGPDDPDA